MKTRYLVLFLSAAGASFTFGACSADKTLDPQVEARLRNDLPAVCTAEQIRACPAVQVSRCPAGQEPVIDYSSDCCAHFTCQPICSSAQQRSCPMTPAPACPAGTKLWIGTAVEDCCPAYRCQPDSTTCDPARGEKCGCDATNVACTLALPYCGPGVMPTVVGQTADCCPIYQCPCGTPMTTEPGDGTPPPVDPSRCGCTYPNCRAGEEVVCEGTDACKGPCYCKPARGICKADSNCAADERCDLSSCRLPPTPADASVAMCDPARCGLPPSISRRVCADGSIAGPTGNCLLDAAGVCSWEIIDCAADACYGVCVPNIQAGCRASSDCPSGQVCEVQCSGWACSSAGTPTTDPATGMTVPPDAACTCPAGDPTCGCDADGNCRGQQCVGRCMPDKPACDLTKPIACPTFAPVCADGQRPIPNGVDPNTCCETYTCPVCDPRAAAASNICPAVRCACAKVIATDPVTCCPKYECGPVNADGSCAI